jgi:hypothetical protein
MAFDQTPIGTLSAELMEGLEQRYGEDAKIGAVAIIVEILSDEHGSQVASKFSDPRAHVNLGLLEIARQGMLE